MIRSLLRKARVTCAVALQLLGFRVGSNMGVKHCLMLALRSQIVECLCEAFDKTYLGVPAIGSFRKKNETRYAFPEETPGRDRLF